MIISDAKIRNETDVEKNSFQLRDTTKIGMPSKDSKSESEWTHGDLVYQQENPSVFRVLFPQMLS